MKTQKILKSNLKVIYDKICNNWKTTLNEHLLWSEGKYIELPQDLIEKGYKEANDEQKVLIEKYFNIEKPKNLLKDVKSFDDVLKISKKTLQQILPYQNPTTENQIKLNALSKIQLIEEVLNDGWKPDWSNTSEYKWHIWFEFKKTTGWVVCGSVFLLSVSDGGVSFFKNKEISDFVSKTFIKEYKEFLTGKIEN